MFRPDRSNHRQRSLQAIGFAILLIIGMRLFMVTVSSQSADAPRPPDTATTSRLQPPDVERLRIEREREPWLRPESVQDLPKEIRSRIGTGPQTTAKEPADLVEQERYRVATRLIASTTALSLPWFDNGESGGTGWEAEPDWALTNSVPAFSGQYAWSDSPDGFYDNDVNSSLYTPPLNVSALGGNGVILSYQIMHSLEFCCDYLFVEYALDGGQWQERVQVRGSNSGYQKHSYSIYVPPGANELQIRFRLWTDSSVVDEGVHLDDIRVDPLTFSCGGVSQIPQAECQALTAFYISTNGPQWATSTGWLASNTPCSWHGVSCDMISMSSGNVTNLSLFNNQLHGMIPAQLGNLSKLRGIFLRWNQLNGAIPSQLGNLLNLEEIDLENNLLSGSIPLQLANLTKLVGCNLSYNQLSGSIPSQLGTLNTLQRLEFHNNRLSGSIPSQLGNMVSLRRLNLSSNQLSGGIPSNLRNLANLEGLWLDNNQ
jgi:hypothetical protein